MLTLKRLFVIVITLLCALSIAACSGTPTTNAQAATNNNSSSGVGTTNEITKETAQSQANKQANNNQTSTKQNNAVVNATINDSQQTSGQTTANLNAQSNAQKANTQSNTNQNSMQNNTRQASSSNKQSSHHTSSTNNTNVDNSSSTNSSSGTSIFIKVAQANINGQMTNILTTGDGMTLYYDTNDTAMNATCTGGCAQTWPPLLAQGQVITSASITSGQITQQATANGSQVEYNGHPLYTYANDSAGQVNGQGVNNVWYAASSVTTQKLKW